jgi:hypothetical protein
MLVEILVPVAVATIAAGPAYLGLRSLRGENTQQHEESRKELHRNSSLLDYVAGQVDKVSGKQDITNADVAELRTWTATHDERHKRLESSKN